MMLPLDQHDDLQRTVREQINTRPLSAAIVFNSHITGLAVARSLGRRGVPVIALDRDPKGYALASKYATVTARCPNVLEDEEGFIRFLLDLGTMLDRPGVLYPTNDEWVLAVNRHRARLERSFIIPFSGPDIVEPVLDKARLYGTARELGIPIPRTWDLAREDAARVAADLPYPCIVKPTEQRSFTDAFGEKVWRIGSSVEFHTALNRAAGHPLVAQEIIGQGLTDFYSVCSYIGNDGEAHGVFVGRKLEQYPPDFGTGCLVAAEGPAAIAERGVQILKAFGYRGISEVEFIYDVRDGEHKLLDVNTRVWKWIGLPIAAGVDLPWLAYADATGTPEVAPPARDGLIWTYARDYISLRLAGKGKETAAYLPEEAWAALFAGETRTVIDAVVDPDDPAPAARMMANLFNPTPYFCAC
ncbi:MAG: carboxylate--amine ligase [Thermomicrobia bacterium]|nr:carboxylate--amine ligase [Thermomicrobia bacterium]MCA1723446.1 carboxylate--amine ligase [Thermomicrobia bacterium]